MTRRASWVVLLLTALVLGCESPDARFHLNMAYIRKQEKETAEFTVDQIQDLADVLVAMFGTPEDPWVPTVNQSLAPELLEIDKLQMAAGQVAYTEDGKPRGLYRRYCANCHGISGDGVGPAAGLLNPYPRDCRAGVFKFKSTPKGSPPTHDDLLRIVVNGMPGTAMPSFESLPDDELEALVQYTKYLSIRGEVERLLIEDMAFELDEGERLDTSPDYLIGDVSDPIVERWLTADADMSVVPARPAWNQEETRASIYKGRELYYGALANCVKCHGESQLGDGQRNDYDDWTKEIADLTRIMTEEERAAAIGEIIELGGLPPRTILPRSLRDGVYRGGGRPEDIFLRIIQGIDGTPMPAVVIKPVDAPPNAKGLTHDDVWHLVDYVLSLPNESPHVAP